MGIFDVLNAKESPVDFLGNSAVKGVKVGANAAKAKVAKEEKAAREAEEYAAFADEGDEEAAAGPKFCPHCGKPLR